MDPAEYSEACAGVVAAFVAAYPDYLRDRLALLDAPDIAEGARQGKEWLEGELRQWSRQPADAQRKGPLQIFQTAFAFPTAALEAAGVEPIRRDAGDAAALPGDTYGLAPASSRDIGEAAWRAHVAWGVAKAKQVAKVVPQDAAPHRSAAVAIVTVDAADRAAVGLTATERGLPVRHWRNPGAIAAGLEKEIPRWAIVDGAHSAADEAVRALADAGSKVAVYAEGEPDDIATARWMALGASTLLPRQKLVAVLESWLPYQA